MNKVLLIGRLTKDPHVEVKESGKQIGFFVLGVDGFTRKSKSDFILIKVWDNLALVVKEHCYKGMQIAVEGKVATSNFQKDGKMQFAMEIVAEHIKFLSGKKENEIVHSRVAQ